MRTTQYAALTIATLTLTACGGEAPAPVAPPPPPPPPATSAMATPPPADTTPAPAPKPALSDLINQTMKTFSEAMMAHDASKAANLYTEDAVWTVYGAEEDHGRDAILKGTQQWLDMSKDMKSAPKRVFMKGNVIASEMVFTGTMTGDFMGMKATNKPFGVVDFIVMNFSDNGLISSVHDYVDAPGFMAQLKGAKTAPPLATLPTAPPEVHIAKGTPEEDKLVDWAKTFNEAFNATDPAKGPPSLLAPEAEVTFYFMGGKVMKAKDLIKFSGDAHKAIPDAKWGLSNAWGIDGFVVVERVETGTFKGPMGPVQPTGKQVTMHLAEVLQPTADGKVLKGWAYGDMMEVSPPPAPKAPAGAKAPAAGAAPKAEKAEKAEPKAAPKAAPKTP
jgi:uncharacterized protein (TIGR02246 family)